VFAEQVLNKLTTFAAHLGAWLAALVGVALCVGIAPSLGPGVDIHVNDAYFIVAHALFSLVPLMCVVAVSVVAWRCRSINLPIRISWIALGIHLLAALLIWRALWMSSVAPRSGDATSSAPIDAWLGITYFASALATLAACLVGWFLSLVRALGRSSVTGVSTLPAP
jgi:hypothetical protein